MLGGLHHTWGTWSLRRIELLAHVVDRSGGRLMSLGRSHAWAQTCFRRTILARTGRLWITKDTSFPCCLARFCVWPRIPKPVISVRFNSFVFLSASPVPSSSALPDPPPLVPWVIPGSTSLPGSRKNHKPHPSLQLPPIPGYAKHAWGQKMLWNLYAAEVGKVGESNFCFTSFLCIMLYPSDKSA